MKFLSLALLMVLGLLTGACSQNTPAPAYTLTPPGQITPTRSPTETQAVATATVTASLTPTATPFPTHTPEPQLALCSPMKGYELNELPEMVANPYHPPAPGSDDPHQGVDLAVFAENSRMALPGSPVSAALPGNVVTIIRDRFPYGNAVLVETPLEIAAAQDWSQAGVPEPAPTLEPRSALTCPAFDQSPSWDTTRRSLYVLYAHLQSTTDLVVGQPVSCGQELGLVGSSGNALNPHLHFEVRVGPASASLGSMAHYDASASANEMATYCLWRVSGLFQLVDPMVLLGYTP